MYIWIYMDINKMNRYKKMAEVSCPPLTQHQDILLPVAAIVNKL